MHTENVKKFLQGQQLYHEKQIAALERSITKLQAAIDKPLSAESARMAQEQIDDFRGRIEAEQGLLDSVKASLAATIAGPESTESEPVKKSKRAKQ